MEQTPSCISVYDGEYFDFLDPDSSVYTVATIAHALSNLCRYTGHVNRFYSVAEHSVLVSLAVPKKFAIEGLFHDAAEAFLGDVSSPLKKLLPEYRALEDAVITSIAKKFNLSPWKLHSKEVHEADKRMYHAERQEIAPGKDNLWHTNLRAARTVKPVGFSPEVAKQLFLDRYNELTESRTDERNEYVRGQGSSQSEAAMEKQGQEIPQAV
jgi:5'-deoxynucleotidase YfbR-like HD superfamily hydrolase